MKSLPFRRYGFAELLILLIILFVIAPFTEKGGISQIIVSCLFFLIVINATYLISKSKKVLISCLLIAIPTIFLHALGLVYSESKTIEVLAILFSLAFFSFIVVAMLQKIFLIQRVTFSIILSSVIIYILIGVTFAFAYSLVDIIVPKSFTVNFSDNVHYLNENAASIYNYFYYSFVVLCTVGFGDVVPASALAKSVSILEAITAQIYLTVIIARLVGMHISKS
jgi:voltage-gated potassium channel